MHEDDDNSSARDLASELSFSIERGQLSAHFQSQIDIATGEVVAAEALCRWDHPERGSIDPDVFIPLAEQGGFIRDIGVFMVRETRVLASRLALDFSVNVSPIQLATEEACAELLRELDAVEVDPRRLTLEITEAIEIVDYDAVIACLLRVRERGFGVSVDDFGSGHASASQLLRLPVTEVKLDRSLTQSEEDEAMAQIAEAMAIADEYGLRVVAEGVETARQLEHVRSIGCDRAQGFLLGHPLAVGAFEASLD